MLIPDMNKMFIPEVAFYLAFISKVFFTFRLNYVRVHCLPLCILMHAVNDTFHPVVVSCPTLYE